jgi:hypothetical protein
MYPSHVIAQGEQISGLADQYGFRDIDTIWNDPNNAALRSVRADPHVLFPGDNLFIPDLKPDTAQRPSDQRHRFQVPASDLRLNLKLDNQFGDKLAAIPCRLSTGDDPTDLTTAGDGGLGRAIPRSAHEGDLMLHLTLQVSKGSTPLDFDLPLFIGDLDPVDEASGQRSRLANLGYYRGGEAPVDDGELASAIEEFQCDQGLPVSGKCDGATQAKLKEVHGS